MITELMYAIVVMSMAAFAFGGVRAKRNGFDLIVAIIAVIVLSAVGVASMARAVEELLLGRWLSARPMNWIVLALCIYAMWRARDWSEALPPRIRDWLKPVLG